jgi:uncharacterized NAD-dependent epimerase/dehydratase family protein
MSFLKETALVYCENQFGLMDGKTTAGLVRHSETYIIVGVIDSALAGKDAGEELDGIKNDIPIFASLESALDQLLTPPNFYIYGKAPLEACIPHEERLLVLDAMQNGMNIINGLHQFFSDDREFAAMAKQCNVTIQDIRKPPSLEDLHVFTGNITKVDIPVIAVLGTDCACGKMTTAVELNQTLNRLGIKSIMIATGQTSLMQGFRYGAAIDALVSQFVIGEIENAVVQAFEQEQPDIILIEGQSALSHPAFMGSFGILKGSMPDGVILQHPPARAFRCDFPMLPMPNVETEIQLIEAMAQTKVLAIALSHENMNNFQVEATIIDYEQHLQLPTTDVLNDGCQKLVDALANQFPKLNQIIKQKSLELLPLLQIEPALSV